MSHLNMAGRGTGPVRFHLQQYLVLVEAQDVEDGLQAMSVERESPHVDCRLRSSVQRLAQSRSSVWPYAQYDPAFLVQTGFIDENHLRTPARRQLDDLVIPLEDLFTHSRDGRSEGLARIMPRESEHARELERFRRVVDRIDVVKHKAGPNHDATCFLRRREQSGFARPCSGRGRLGASNGIGDGHQRAAHKWYDQRHARRNEFTHSLRPSDRTWARV